RRPPPLPPASRLRRPPLPKKFSGEIFGEPQNCSLSPDLPPSTPCNRSHHTPAAIYHRSSITNLHCRRHLPTLLTPRLPSPPADTTNTRRRLHHHRNTHHLHHHGINHLLPPQPRLNSRVSPPPSSPLPHCHPLHHTPAATHTAATSTITTPLLPPSSRPTSTTTGIATVDALTPSQPPTETPTPLWMVKHIYF
nr:hypothetical protein [Tanacetum cinerariifolium]